MLLAVLPPRFYMFTITEQWIRAYSTRDGGWKKRQLDSIGVRWPPEKGWIERSLGRTISDEKKADFEKRAGARGVFMHRDKQKKAKAAKPEKAVRQKLLPRSADYVKDDEFYISREWRELRYLALRNTDGRCQCCGASQKDGVRIHVDHIIPRYTRPDLGLSLDNLQVLCEDCNYGKGAWDATDWR